MPEHAEVNDAVEIEPTKSSRGWIMAASGFAVVAIAASLTWLLVFRNDGRDPVASNVGTTSPTISPTINPTISPTISPTINPIIIPANQGTPPARRAEPVLIPVGSAPVDRTAPASDHPPVGTDPAPALPSSAEPAASAPPSAANASPGAPAVCSGVKQWLNIESVHAVFRKDSTYRLTLVLANKLDTPISVTIIWPSMQLNDDEHNPSPAMGVDFPTEQWYTPGADYAKSVYRTGMKITREEPQPVTFSSGNARNPSKHVSLSAHIVIAEDNGSGGIVASHTVLRCNDLPVE